jgi:hypothetical protein
MARDLKNRLTVLHLVGFIAVCGLVAFLVKSWQDSRSYDRASSDEQNCQSNLNNIAIALMNYSQTLGRFPPPFSTGGVGKKTQSWRATILPWFAFDFPMATQYNRDKTWDSPVNARLAGSVPPFYRCPSQTNSNSASYFMINDLSKFDIASIPPKAILVIEISGVDHAWSDPNEDAVYQAQSIPSASDHPRGLGVILSDFSRLRVKDSRRIKKQESLYLLVD